MANVKSQTDKGVGFRGMSNLAKAPGHYKDKDGFFRPSFALNVDVLQDGVLKQRRGFSKSITFQDAHSLWAGSIMLAVDSGTLYRLEGSQAYPLADVGYKARLNYQEVNNLIYMSSPFWKGIYDLLQDEILPWGLPLPPGPDVSLVPGNLPPGIYKLCYTNTDGDRISGNGAIVQVAWENETRGIQLNNLPAKALCWITQPNGKKLLLAQLTGDQITNITIRPLLTLGVCPPPCMSNFIQNFGRIWGARGASVFYSDPFQYEWFRPNNYLPFPEEIVMIVPVLTGIFFHSRNNTWFGEGGDPKKMQINWVGVGAIPDTLSWSHLEGGSFSISRELTSQMIQMTSKLPTPVWLSRYGFTAGTNSGRLIYLTDALLQIDMRAQGAAGSWVLDGYHQILISTFGPLLTPKVNETLEEVRRKNGSLIN